MGVRAGAHKTLTYVGAFRAIAGHHSVQSLGLFYDNVAAERGVHRASLRNGAEMTTIGMPWGRPMKGRDIAGRSSSWAMRK
mgnify:CR=1 FL=1